MIDSRASTASSGTPERRRRSGRATGLVTSYDFRRPITLSREKSRLLTIAFETFARQASTVMTSALRSVCHVEMTSMDQVAYSEYVGSLGDMTYMTVFSVDPITQPAVLQTPLEVTMACVERLLGGRGMSAQPERPLTDLESAVVTRLYERLVAEVRYAFSSLVLLEPKVTTVEYSPQLAQVASASDVMVVARLQLQMGDNEYPLSLAISFPGLVPYLNAADGAETISERDRLLRQDSTTRLTEGLQEVPVEVAVCFRTTGADPMELAGLQVGDVVRLKHPAQAPLDVTAADVVFAHATPGTQGQRLAALVVAPPHSS